MKKSEIVCGNEVEFLTEDTETRSLFDAAAILNDNIEHHFPYNFNSYDDCLSFKQQYPGFEKAVEGQYCMAEFHSNEELKKYYSGLCYPESCDHEVLQAMTSYSLGEAEKNLTNFWCHSRHVKLKTGDHFAIAFFIFWIIVVISSTLYDYIQMRRKKLAIKLLTSFSLYSNTKRIFTNIPGSNRNVNCLYAIRTLSILWLIISDRFDLLSKSKLSNQNKLNDWMKTVISTFLVASDVAYDSLFLVTGFLLALYCYRAFEMKRLSYLPLLLHRYIRYMPLILLSLTYHLTLMKHLVKGPFTHTLEKRIENCEKYGFTSLLMVENYMGADRMCLFHGWYFSMDFQFFILTPIFVYFCHKSRTMGFFFMSILIGFIYGIQLGIIIDSNEPYNVFNRYSMFHMHSHYRCVPWIAAIVLASYCIKDDIKVSKKYRVINTIISFLIIIIHLVFTYTVKNDNIASFCVVTTAIYSVVHRILWPIAISWIIFYCYSLDKVSIIQRILNKSMWRPLAKLNLTILIVYPIYQNSMIYSRKTVHDFNSWATFHAGVGDIAISVLLSLLFHAGIEMPFVVIEQQIYETIRMKRKIRKVEVIRMDVKGVL